MVDWVKMILCKHENLSLHLQQSSKMPEMAACTFWALGGGCCWSANLTNEWASGYWVTLSQDNEVETVEKTLALAFECALGSAHVTHTYAFTTTHIHRSDNTCGPCHVCWGGSWIRLPVSLVLVQVRNSVEVPCRGKASTWRVSEIPERVPCNRLSFLVSLDSGACDSRVHRFSWLDNGCFVSLLCEGSGGKVWNDGCSWSWFHTEPFGCWWAQLYDK